MKPRHQVSRAAIELIKRFEGYRSKAARLPDGRWTIGYGHTLTAREGAEVSKDDAEALLIYDLIAVAHVVNEQTYTPLTQNQFDALCAFAFNIGIESFRRSAVLRRVNEGQLLQAACAMELWRKADFEGERIVIDALVRRRAAEKTLFLTPTAGFIPVPTPLLRPNLDLDGAGAVPRQTPTALKSSLDGAVALVERDEAEAPAPVEAPSAMQAAAEAVSARLATIFPDEEPDAPAEPAVAEAAPESATEPEAFELTAPESDAEMDAEPVAEEAEPEAEEAEAPTLFDAPANDLEPALDAEPEAVVEPEAEPEAESEIAVEPEAEPVIEAEPELPSRLVIEREEDFPRILHLEPEPEDYDVPETEQPKFSYLPLMALAGLGGAIFGGGIFWAVSAQGGPGGGWVFGWLVALVGIIVLGRAAYLFLERLGQIGGGLDDDDLNGK